jgi:HEAT repeat protein
VRTIAVSSLDTMRIGPDKALEVYSRALGDQDSRVRAAALMALGFMENRRGYRRLQATEESPRLPLIDKKIFLQYSHGPDHANPIAAR